MEPSNGTKVALDNMTHSAGIISSNSTATESPAALIAYWNLAPIVDLLTFVFGTLTNGLLLLQFLKDANLHTAFNVYLINLLVANLACLLIQYPLQMLSDLYRGWYLTDAACSAYSYGNFVLQAAIKNAHGLIALNRIWAVLHPISYRYTNHKIKSGL